MPAANLLSVSANGSPTAPVKAPAGAGGVEPFDAFLALQELAASASGTALDLGIDAGAAELDGDVKTDDADGEDSIEDDPLAFLAGLLSLTAPVPAPHLAGAAAAADGDEVDDAVVGLKLDAGGGSSTGEGDVPMASVPPLGDSTDPARITGNTAASALPSAIPAATDTASAATRTLAAQVALVTGDSPSKDDPTASVRSGDLLAQSPRAPIAVDHPPIATHVRDPRWADEFANRIALQVNQRESVASISLTPVDLGPVDVNVTVRDSQATIHFGAAQAETRALIEASLPKLRELLAAQGFQLMDASVSSQGFRQSKPQTGPSVPRPSNVEEVTPVTTRTIVMNGLLDTYA